MIRSVNVYVRSAPFQTRLDSLQWLVTGMVNLDKDLKVEAIQDFTYKYADLSIIYGMPKPFEGEGKLSRSRSNIIAGAQFTNTPVLILDMPVFGRQMGNADLQCDAYRIMEGHALNYGKYPSGETNRWPKIAKRYDIKLKSQSKGNVIGIASQRQADADMFGINILDWIDSTITALKAHTNDPIAIKPHSLDRSVDNSIYDSMLAKHNVTLIDDISVCKSLITYTSSISVDALIAGIPVISCHPANFLYNNTSNDVLDAINPSLDNRLDALKKLSYIQWTKAEMQSGLAWKHIRNML